MNFDFSKADRRFTATVEKAATLGPGDFRTAFRRISRAWLELIDAGFVREEDPYGNGWDHLSKRRLAEKRKKGYPSNILQATGQMRSAWKAAVTRTGFSIFNDRSFSGNRTAAFHQFGGTNVDGNAFTPARPMIPLDGMPDHWTTIAEGYLNDDIDKIFI